MQLQPRSLFNRYDPIFNFFFSKPISEICDDTESPSSKLLKQISYLSPDNEFLKRFYTHDEVPQRIEILYEIHHPKQLWAVETATLASEVGREAARRRVKKQKKLARQLAEIQEEEPESFDSRWISSFTDPGSREDGGANQPDRSYQTTLHDIYSEYSDAPLNPLIETLSKQAFSLSTDDQTDCWGEADGPSHLTLDFDDLIEKNILTDYAKLKSRQKVVCGNVDLNVQEKDKPELPKLIQLQKQDAQSKSNYYPSQHMPLMGNIQLSPSRKAEKLTALRSLKKEIEISREQLPAAVTSPRNSGYISPRLNELSQYYKKVFEKSGISRQHFNGLDSNLKRQEERIQRIPAPSRFNQNRQVEEMYRNRIGYDRQTRFNQRFVQSTGFNKPMQTSNIPMQTSNAHSFRSPQFEQIRKKAMELIRQERNYPVVRIGSPRYQLFRRTQNNY